MPWRSVKTYCTIWLNGADVSPDGCVISKPLWDAPYHTNAHDIWLTPDHRVMPFQPFISTTRRIEQGLGVFGWDTELPITIGLIPRHGFPNAAVRWIECDIEPEHVMHTMSANVENGKLTLDAPIFDRPPFPFETDFKEGDGHIIVPVSKWAQDLSEFLIFDTHDVTQGPIATIDIPFHMGWTPHGRYTDFRSY
jgi:carotenoid cleavage dioxygenase-like enzyme